MKTIIAPTDFSESSLNAVNYAADMAVEIKANLLLLHIVELPATTVAEFPVTEIAYHQISRADELEKLQAEVQGRAGSAITVTSTEILGNINYELRQTCDLVKPFAVVMSTHAPSALERLFFGSKTVYSAEHLHAPVINVPAGMAYKPIRKIGFACDFRDIYHIPVDEIKTVGRAFNASLELFYVTRDEHELPSIETEKTLLLNRLREFEPAFTVVKSDTIENGAVSFATEHKIDLVLLVPRKHGWFEKHHTSDVLFHLPVPAITIHEE